MKKVFIIPVKNGLPKYYQREDFSSNMGNTVCSFPYIEDKDVKSALEFRGEPYIFFVETKLVNNMLDTLKKLFGYKNAVEPEAVEPKLKELGDVKDRMSKSYLDIKFDDEHIIGRIFSMPIDTSNKTNPLQQLMDRVTHDENEIDAVFVASVQGDCVIAKSELSNNPNRQIDAELMNSCLIGLKKLPMIRDLRKGELDFAVFQLKGGIVCLSLVENRDDLWLGFISATPEGMSRLLFFRDKYLAEFNRLVAAEHN